MSIHKKLLDFHKNFKGATRTGQMPKRGKYFTLDDVVQAVTEPLGNAGLHAAHYLEGGVLITCIYDEDGDKFCSYYPVKFSDNPQATGSMITYAKRYNLCALLNVADRDDDGEEAKMQSLLDLGATTGPEMATNEQMAIINDYFDAGQIPDPTVKYIEDRQWELTSQQANRIISICKDANDPS